MLLEVLLWGCVGLIIGSFTNVLILRYGKKSLGGRSACPHCHRTLVWYELVPVLSWLALRGRCRTCHHWISLQYPLVELLTGASFIGIGLSYLPLLSKGIACAIVVLLIAIAVYDLRYTIMPDRWVFSFAAFALLYSMLMMTSLLRISHQSFLELLLAGPLVAAPLWLLWRVSGGAWMGFGDVKFALGMGWLLGAWHGIVALMLAFIIGAAIGVCVLLPLPHIVRVLDRIGITRFRSGGARFTMKSEVPFGPFLIFATCILWFPSMYTVDSILPLVEAFRFSSFSW